MQTLFYYVVVMEGFVLRAPNNWNKRQGNVPYVEKYKQPTITEHRASDHDRSLN